MKVFFPDSVRITFLVRFEFSQKIATSTESLWIIGDLHGQLFNLMAYLVRIKEESEKKAGSWNFWEFLCFALGNCVFFWGVCHKGYFGEELFWQ